MSKTPWNREERPRGNTSGKHRGEIPRGNTSRRFLQKSHRGELSRIFLRAMPRRASGVFIRDACLREGFPREEILRGEIPGNPSQGVFPREAFSGSLSLGVFPRAPSKGPFPRTLPKDPSQGGVPPILSVDRLFFRQERPVFSAILGGRERGRGFWSSMWMSCWY